MAPIAGTLVEVTVEAAFTARLIGRGFNFITLLDVRDADGAESPTAVTGFRVRADSRTARPMSFHVGRPIYGPFVQGCFLTSTVTLAAGKARFILSDEAPQGLQSPFESAGAVPVADNGGTLSIDDGGASITVDGTVTVTEPVSVDDNAGSLTVDDGGASLTIDGQVTLSANAATVADANPLPVDDAGGTLSVDDGGGVLTVDGTVTVQDGGGAISVDDNGTTISVDDGLGSLTVDSPQLPAALVNGNLPIHVGTLANGFIPVGTAAGSNAATIPLWVNASTGAAFPVTDNAGTLTVDDGGGALTVDGTVTVQDGGGAISVDDNGTTLSVDDGAGSLTVDAPLGAPVHVNLVQNNAMINAAAPLNVQPGTGISFPVTDNAGTLSVDDGAGTLTVDDGGLTLSIDDGAGAITVDGTVTVQDGGSSITVDGTTYQEATAVYNGQHIHAAADDGTYVALDGGGAAVEITSAGKGYVAKIGVSHPAITSGAVKIQYKRTAGGTYRDLYVNNALNEQNLGAGARVDGYSFTLCGRGFYSFPIKLTAPDLTEVEVNIEIHPVSAN